MRSNRKGFTLIELLIVVAIIGILAGVGIPMYNGYMAKAKIESTLTNHSNSKSFIAASFAKCSAGSTIIDFGISLVSPAVPGSSTTNCSSSDSIAMAFKIYFNKINKNPHDSSLNPVEISTSNTPPLGMSHLSYSILGGNPVNTMTIITNIGDENGGNVYTNKESIVME
jgi:type IV pilus assembly protein PilA